MSNSSQHFTSPRNAVLVGREPEMAQVKAAIADVQAGNGRLLLVFGEPGIGKTRIAQEAAALASGALRVLWGRCHETGGAPPFWPWMQVLRAVMREYAPGALRTVLGGGAADIAQIVPEVREHFPELPSPRLEPEAARFRLFDSIITFLRQAASQWPLLLIFDDLQQADTPSLRVLQFLAQELVDAPMLVIGTYRDVEVGRDHPLFAALGGFGREPTTRRLQLRGLGEDEVGRYIALTAGFTPPGSMVRAVFQETEGNPFFVGEVVRLLAAEGRLTEGQVGWAGRLAIPQSLHEVIRQRLRGLSPSCCQVLTVAAVIGRELGLNVLERAVGETPLPALDEALAARIIQDVADGAGRYRFAHVLIREVLYQQLGTAERVRLHRLIGEILESLHCLHPEPHLTELAYHFVSAAPGGARDKAIDYAMKAGNLAAAQMAHEEAARHYEMALQVFDLTGPGDGRQVCQLLLLLSEARWRAGEYERAKEVSAQAAALARALGAAEALGRAALGFAGQQGFGIELYDEAAIGLLEEALAVLPAEDSPLRARLLARLAEELAPKDCDARRWALCREAVEMARRIDDPALLASVLKSSHTAHWLPHDVAGRLARATEIAQLAARVGDGTLEFEGLLFRLLALMEQGETAAVYAAVDACQRMAEKLRQPYCRWYLGVVRAGLAIMEGRLKKADELAQAAGSLGEQAQNNNAGLFFGAQLGHLLWMQGHLGQLESNLVVLRDLYPLLNRPFSCGLALTYSEQGRRSEARDEFERLAAANFSDIHLDTTWLPNACLLAIVCAFLDDAPRAHRLYELLLPAAQQNVVMYPYATLGAASHYLGLLAATMGDRVAAEAHFADALAMNAGMGTRQWVARTQVAYAQLLLAGGVPRDVARARELLGPALETARELEMPTIIAAASALMQQAEAAARNDAAPAEMGETLNGTPVAIFRKEGEFWTVGFAGGVVRVKHRKGLGYLAYLLRNAGHELYAGDLVAAINGTPGVDAECTPRDARVRRRLARVPDHASMVLDAAAAAAYQRRRLALGDEMEEAERLNDLGRLADLREEFEMLTEQLMVAANHRRFASTAERARLAVTKGIKAAVKLIADCDPRLGRYLATRVHTGYLCVYRPDPEHPIRWEL